MKKYIFVILAIILISGCTREERGQLTQRGHEICSAWNTAVDAILTDDVNPAFILNTWIISDEAERYIIEDRYLPQYKIRQVDATTYGLYKGAEPYFTINTHGTHITDEGAVWTVTNHFGYSYAIFPIVEEDRTVSITNLGNDQWSIALDSASFPQSVTHWTLSLERFTNHCSIFAENFTLSGDGTFAFPAGKSWEFEYGETGEPVMQRYTIERPMQNDANDGNELKWRDGKLALTVSHSGYENVDVVMEVLAYFHYGITYRGVTEVWDRIEDAVYYE